MVLDCLYHTRLNTNLPSVKFPNIVKKCVNFHSKWACRRGFFLFFWLLHWVALRTVNLLTLFSRENVGKQIEGKTTVNCIVNFAVCRCISRYFVSHSAALHLSFSRQQPNQVDPKTPVTVCVFSFGPKGPQPRSTSCLYLSKLKLSAVVVLVVFQYRTATTELRGSFQWTFTSSVFWPWLLLSSWWERPVRLFVVISQLQSQVIHR